MLALFEVSNFIEGKTLEKYPKEMLFPRYALFDSYPDVHLFQSYLPLKSTNSH